MDNERHALENMTKRQCTASQSEAVCSATVDDMAIQAAIVSIIELSLIYGFKPNMDNDIKVVEKAIKEYWENEGSRTFQSPAGIDRSKLI